MKRRNFLATCAAAALAPALPAPTSGVVRWSLGTVKWRAPGTERMARTYAAAMEARREDLKRKLTEMLWRDLTEYRWPTAPLPQAPEPLGIYYFANKD